MSTAPADGLSPQKEKRTASVAADEKMPAHHFGFSCVRKERKKKEKKKVEAEEKRGRRKREQRRVGHMIILVSWMTQ